MLADKQRSRPLAHLHFYAVDSDHEKTILTHLIRDILAIWTAYSMPQAPSQRDSELNQLHNLLHFHIPDSSTAGASTMSKLTKADYQKFLDVQVSPTTGEM